MARAGLAALNVFHCPLFSSVSAGGAGHNSPRTTPLQVIREREHEKGNINPGFMGHARARSRATSFTHVNM